MNEWVKLMLEEVRRKQREHEEALRERQRRKSPGSGTAPGDGARSGPSDRPGAPGRG